MVESHTLLERDAEIELVERAIESAGRGDGSSLAIEGPPGIGKTSLLVAAREIGESRGMLVLTARATEIEREFPYGAVRQLFESPLRSSVPAERDELLAAAAAPAAWVLGLSPAGSPPPEPGAALNALHWLLANLAKGGSPCLLLVDDAQWADPDSLRFLTFLSPRLPELPVSLIVAARSDPRDVLSGLAGTASDPGTRPLTPAPLSPVATEQIVREELGSVAAPEFASACHRSTGGNPFYLRALLEVMRGDGVEPAAEAADRALTLGPQTVTRAIVTRVARLSAPTAPVARALAVLGDGADLDHAARLAAVDPAASREAVDELIGASILEGEGELRFAHPILRNAVYADIGRSERAELHRRAAELLGDDGAAPERVAAHLLAVAPAGDGDVVATLRAAAADAAERGAPEPAVAHLRRALAEPPSAAERAAVLFELGTAELTVAGAAAVEHLRAALDLVEDPARRAPIVRALAQACFSAGDVEGGVGRLRDELAASDGAGQSALVEVDLILALTMSASPDLVREAQERAERLAAGVAGTSPEERAALDCLCFCRLRRGTPVADVVGPLRMRVERTPPDEPISSIQVLMTAGVLVRCDELDLAEEWSKRLLTEAKASGSIFGLAAASWLLGDVAHRRGRLVEAVSRFEHGLRMSHEYGARWGVHSSLTGLVGAQIDRGELDSASEALAAAGWETDAPDAALVPAGELLESRARLHLARGDAQAALRDLDVAAAQFRNGGDPGPGVTTWRLGAALAHVRLGETERAAELAAEALERARAFALPSAMGVALRTAGLVTGGDEGIAMLRDSVAELERSPLRLELARSSVELGAALRRSGERAEARDHLAAGLEIARSCGALPLAERAHEELRAAGTRLRKVVRTGVEALTPSEARVARLAAAGMSNREIAQELFVTAKTVEFHLGQTYRKLEVASRTELESALSAVDADD